MVHTTKKICVIFMLMLNFVHINGQNFNGGSGDLKDTLSYWLDEIVVKNSWLYRRDGNVIVDFSQMPMEQNMQLSDAMKHIPGVVKSTKGSYLLNGKQADIYINNIRQNISENSLETFLAGLPTDMVANIELVFVNSGKYSASSEAIININTKTNINLGQSVHPYLFTSFFPHGWYDTGGNVFYMQKKSRWLYNATLSYANERYYKTQNDSLWYKGNLILDDYSNDDGLMDVVTFRGSALHDFSNGSFFNINTYVYYDKENIDQYWSNLGFEYNKKKRAHSDLYNVSLSYISPKQKKKFNGNITYSFSYGNDNSHSVYETVNQAIYKKADLRLCGYMNTVNMDLNTKVSAFHFSYGVQLDYNSVKDKTQYSYNNTDKDIFEKFSGYEILSALYTQLKYSFSDRLSSRIGVRVENTSYSYDIVKGRHHNNYTDFFPSFLTYYDIKNYYSTIGIVSNISRPKYAWMVSGERQYNDAVSVFGNRDLKPTKLYGLVFYNTFFQYLTVNLSYILTCDYIGSLYELKGHSLYSTYQNIADKEAFRTNFTIPFQFYSRQISGQVQVDVSYDKMRNMKNGFILPQNRKDNYWNASINANIGYMPNERLGISIDGKYSPCYNSPLLHIDSNGSVDIEVQYNMLKEKNLTLTISARDLIQKDTKNTIYFGDSRYHTQKCSIGPIFLVSLKLKLNKGQKVVEEYRDYTPSSSRLR